METPLRILHVVGIMNYGGAESMIMNLYRQIDKEKIQFDFIVHTDNEGVFDKEILENGGRIYRMKRYKVTNTISIVNAWKNFFSHHPEYKILHSHIRSYASVYIPIAKKYGLTTIAHSHSTSNGKGIPGKIKDIMQFPVRRQADYLFACSDEAGRWMFGNNVTTQSNYRMIPNAIDSERFKFDFEKRILMRKQLEVDDCLVIGTIGRLTVPKNQKFLIDIFSEVHKRNERTKLLIVGDGELRPELQNQVDALGLHDCVLFVGSKKNTQDYYQAMDVFAFPSFWEGLGIVAIEAQCSGLPCVVSERIPKSIDMNAGLVSVADLKDRVSWIDKLMMLKQDRISQNKAVKNAGYDIAENAVKLQGTRQKRTHPTQPTPNRVN